MLGNGLFQIIKAAEFLQHQNDPNDPTLSNSTVQTVATTSQNGTPVPVLAFNGNSQLLSVGPTIMNGSHQQLVTIVKQETDSLVELSKEAERMDAPMPFDILLSKHPQASEIVVMYRFKRKQIPNLSPSQQLITTQQDDKNVNKKRKVFLLEYQI